MTQPAFTDLPSSSDKEIAIRALTLQGQHGAVSMLSREYGLHRQDIYDLRDQAVEAIAESFAVRKHPGSFTMQVSEADIARTVIALRVATPSSIRDEVAMLPIIYKMGWSYGKIQGLLVTAAQKAKELQRQVDLSTIKTLALDEMFSQGRPVFGGIDLDSRYLFLLDVCPDRSGAEWAKNLGQLGQNQNLLPDVVVKDAGSGLGSGVGIAWPVVEERDDLFHAVYIMGKEAAHLERRAYGSITAFDKSNQRLARPCKPEQLKGLVATFRRALRHMNESINLYDRFECLRQEANRLLTLTERGSGRLRTGEEVRIGLTRIGTEMKLLGGIRIEKVANYLVNRAPGLGKYLDALQLRLDAITESAGGPDGVAAAVRAFQASLEINQGGPWWDRKARRMEMQEAASALQLRIAQEPGQALKAVQLVFPLLAARHRASSAIENLNSVLRPYLTVQKHVSQDFLDLFRFYWNTRTQEWGRYKDRSAHELLTGTKVQDWLTLLGYPPSSVTVS